MRGERFTHMQENETAAEESSASTTAGEGGEQTAATPATEEISYHAVEKDGNVTAIWEMQGRKHLRTIDPRSRQGLEIFRYGSRKSLRYGDLAPKQPRPLRVSRVLRGRRCTTEGFQGPVAISDRSSSNVYDPASPKSRLRFRPSRPRDT